MRWETYFKKTTKKHYLQYQKHHFVVEGAEFYSLHEFFQESYAELRKVVWPGSDEVISSTKVVIISVYAFT